MKLARTACSICPCSHLVVLQTVHFIRHGEGFHNIGFDNNVDAHLTPFGWSQAHALHDHIQSLQRPLDVQVNSNLDRSAPETAFARVTRKLKLLRMEFISPQQETQEQTSLYHMQQIWTVHV